MWLNLYLITTLVSGIINVSKSMYIKKKMEYNNDEVIRKFNKLSTEAKIMSNIKNIFITLCPVVNIIHSIKNLRTSNDSLYSKVSLLKLGLNEPFVTVKLSNVAIFDLVLVTDKI